jgi:tRNA1Val (adenine37-N6)-methyltransferase
MQFDEQALTVDSILNGPFTIVQPASGYRFAIDSILLARFARPRSAARILELGAGCGVVSVMLAVLHRPTKVVAVEVQPQLAAMIARNAVLNKTELVSVVCADIRRAIPGLGPAMFDYLIANPPYRAALRGRESPYPERRVARGGDGAMLSEFIAAAAHYASRDAKIAVVFTASRTAELITEMKRRSLEPKRIRFVHSTASDPATMILLEARKGGGIEVIVEPPLVIYSSPGVYTDEARAMLTCID